MKTTDTHIYFWNGIYSNWHPAPFTDPNTKTAFVNSEQAFMWYKAMHFHDTGTADKVLLTSDPKAVKALGRLVKNYDESKWKEVRYNIMVDVNYYKFSQNEAMKQELLASGDKVIVEASPYDKIWGVGLLEDDPLILDEKNWQGENLLGKAIMDVRKLLRTGTI